MADERELERLRATQQRRQLEEERAREQASDPDERHVHRRRAEKANYLSAKLAAQAETPDD